jgi:hypothetical protein
MTSAEITALWEWTQANCICIFGPSDGPRVARAIPARVVLPLWRYLNKWDEGV